MIGFSLLISGLVLAIMNPIHEEDMKGLLNNPNPTIYVFGCLLLGLVVLGMVNVMDKEDC